MISLKFVSCNLIIGKNIVIIIMLLHKYTMLRLIKYHYCCLYVCSLYPQLLHKCPKSRLACSSGGAREIKAHTLFKVMNWKRLEAGMCQPPFEPDVSGHGISLARRKCGCHNKCCVTNATTKAADDTNVHLKG